MLGHRRATAAGGWLRLAGPAAFLGKLLETVGLTRASPGFPTVAEALATR